MNRHPLDLFSLGAGIAFALLALAFLAAQWIDIALNGAIVLPLLLVFLGGLGLLAAVRAQRANDDALRTSHSAGSSMRIDDDALQG